MTSGNSETGQTDGKVDTTSTNRRIAEMRRVSSQELLAGHKELVIEHSGEEYRLRMTGKGKLILTK